MKAIWMYSRDQKKQAAVQKAAAAVKAQVRDLTPKDLEKPVGAIIGMPVFGKPKAVKVPPLYMLPEMLLFSGITSDEMDVFLDVYKKQGVSPVAIKAMATPFNVSWTLYELVEELRREHSALTDKQK